VLSPAFSSQHTLNVNQAASRMRSLRNTQTEANPYLEVN
jgi:hypothetical protein